MSTFREPVFNLETLTNSDTVIDWLNRTNQIINAVNSFYLVDVFQGDGINLTRSEGIVTIDIDAGTGVSFNEAKELVISFSNVQLLSTTSNTTSPTNETDYVLLSRDENLFKVSLEDLLPETINHQHTFNSLISFTNKINTTGIVLQDQTSLLSGAEINFTYDNEKGYPNGINLKTSLIDSGINISPEAFIRNYYPEFITLTDDPNRDAGTDYIGEGVTSEDTFTTTANFNFATTTFPNEGDPYFTDGPLKQKFVALNFYTGVEGDDGGIPYVTNPNILGTTNLTWPMKWSMKFAEGYYTIVATEGYRSGTGTLNTYETIKYTYNEDSNLSEFEIFGKISISNLAESEQFVTGPGGENKVPLTNTDGLLNKKFINRIVTSNYTTLSVGNLVYASNLTNDIVWYEKALADSSSNYDVIGIVESIDAGVATIVTNGEFELDSVTTLVPGTKYYLSQTITGEYVDTEYSTGIIKPVFIAISDSSGLLTTATTSSSSITNISVFGSTDTESNIEINSPSYDLGFVAGQNISLDVDAQDRIVISVEGLAGTQDTFKTFELNGVGSTDGDVFVTSEAVDEIINITSNSLTIIGDDTAKSISFETPNAFTNFKFTNDSSEFTHYPDTQFDTLNFVAGVGITFEQDTNDAIIINASIEGGVSPGNIVYTGPYQMLFSDENGEGTLVSLEGGDVDEFENTNGGNILLDSSLPITHGGGTSTAWTYNGQTYNLDVGYPPNRRDEYIPDEIAGYMVGRISNPNTEFPDNKIRRLNRKDVRTFLGIATTGYIDEITNVFNRWELYDSDDEFTQIGEASAEDKDGALVFEAGDGIQLEARTDVTPKRIKISNTGVAQNAYGSLEFESYEGETIYTHNAASSSDTFTFKSGRFVKITATTDDPNAAVFDIDISDNYVILGNSGTTDGMGVIDLSSESVCLVGRGGGEIQALGPDILKWTGNDSTDYAQPTVEFPYFGAVLVNTSGPGTLLTADGSEKGLLRFVAGTGISFSADSSTNEITITNTGTGDGVTGLTAIRINNKGVFTIGPDFNEIRFSDNNGKLEVTGQIADGTTILNVDIDLRKIQANSVLANDTNNEAKPTALNFGNDQVLAKIGNNTLTNANIKGTGPEEGTLRKALAITNFSKVQKINWQTGAAAPASGTFTPSQDVDLSVGSLSSSHTSGIPLRFSAGRNMSLSLLGISTISGIAAPHIVCQADTNLYTDIGPTLYCANVSGVSSFNTPATAPFVSSLYRGKVDLTAFEGVPNPFADRGDTNKAYFKENRTGTADYIVLGHKNVAGTSHAFTDLLYKEIHFSPDNTIDIIKLSDIASNATPSKAFGLPDSIYAGSANANIPGLQEYNYAKYYRTHYWDVINDTASKWEVVASDIILNSSNLSLGANGVLSLSSKRLSASNNMMSLNSSSTSSPFNIISFGNLTTTPTTGDAASSPMHFYSTGLKFSINGSIGSPASFIQIAKSATSGDNTKIFTTDGTKVVFDHDIDFGIDGGTTRQINFENCNITGMTISPHKTTHQSSDTFGFIEPSGPPGTDELLHWQIGAVSMHRPTLRNTIFIVRAGVDGAFGQNFVENNYEETLYDGTSNSAGDLTSGITNATRGPLYIVLPAGFDVENDTSIDGPPGQLLFVRA